nr:metalloregulator ArsR/SmtB family transcription factor [uncultured Dyadobacter sp.]
MKNTPTGSEKVIWMLKTTGPQPLTAIAEELNITTEGARFQLLKLAGEGLVQSSTVSKGRGRPQQIWALTKEGESRFPDSHAELTVKLISTIRDTLGQEALNAVIEANSQNGLRKYMNETDGAVHLEDRIARLAGIRDQEGYMVEYMKDAEGYLLIENHCPICAAATACQDFCRYELNTFQAVLGDGVDVRRVDHILAGARRCAYRISEK